MTFEFHGADLETAAGQDALLTVLPFTFDDENFSTLIEELDDDKDGLIELAKSNIEAFKTLTSKTLEQEDPRARYLAGKLAIMASVVDPEFATDLLVTVLSDENPLVRESAGWVTDMMSDKSEVWKEEFETLGIMRLAKIAKAYKENRPTDTQQ